MIYKAKEGSKAYEYIKSICEAEDKECKAYVKRVEEAVGFELDKFGGYMPDSTLTRICKVTSILVDKKKWEQLDKKLWKEKEVKNPVSTVCGISEGNHGDVSRDEMMDFEVVGSIHDKEWQEKLKLNNE